MALYTEFYGIAVAVVRLAAIGVKMSFAQLLSKYKLDHDIVFDFLGAGGILEKSIGYISGSWLRKMAILIEKSQFHE